MVLDWLDTTCASTIMYMCVRVCNIPTNHVHVHVHVLTIILYSRCGFVWLLQSRRQSRVVIAEHQSSEYAGFQVRYAHYRTDDSVMIAASALT